MGLVEGILVGLLEGLVVGSLVGVFEGNVVGLIVGNFVLYLEGAYVCSDIGFLVGLMLVACSRAEPNLINKIKNSMHRIFRSMAGSLIPSLKFTSGEKKKEL